MRIIEWDADGILDREAVLNQFRVRCVQPGYRLLHTPAALRESCATSWSEVNRGFQGIEEWMPKGKLPEAVTA